MNKNNPSVRGLIHERRSLEKFKLEFIAPPVELQSIISRFWHVSWDLPDGEIYNQTNLPFPVQHLVIDPVKGSGLYGSTLGAFSYELSGKGSVLGARFFPGAARTLTKKSITITTGSMICFHDIFGLENTEFEALLADNLPELVTKLSEIISDHASSISPRIKLAREMVEFIEEQNTLTDLSSLSCAFDLSARQIQRVFQDYIGVSPKWVIDRYRMFEALDALNKGRDLDLAQLALQLDYSDQAHFSHQFKKLTGQSPKKYLKAQAY